MIRLDLDQSLGQLEETLSSLSYGRHPMELRNVALPNLPTADELVKGNIEIPSEDIETDHEGRAIVHNHLVLIYIKDQGYNYPDVMGSNLEKGKMIHLRRCAAVKNREANGGGDRYHAIIRDDGFFPVYRQGYMAIEKAQLARRRVCLTCLKELSIRYSSYNGERGVSTFDFSAYLNGELSSDKLFGAVYIEPNNEKYPEDEGTIQNEPFRAITIGGIAKPLNTTPDNETVSTSIEVLGSEPQKNDLEIEYWKEISQTLREKYFWRCIGCSVYLGDHRSLLHVHHRNGNKGDNREGNLAVLCKECHSQQPNHEHLKPTLDEQKIIDHARDLTSNWPLGEAELVSFLLERLPNLDTDNTKYEVGGEVLVDAIAIDAEAKIAICQNQEYYEKEKLGDWKIIDLDRLDSLNDLQQKIDLYSI